MDIKRALLSVSDKDGIIDFAKGLNELGIEIISTGGTFKQIHEAGIPVLRVSDVTASHEILDGRVKTLHPAIHGGILAKGDEAHQHELDSAGITRIGIVAVNLYPFEQTVAKEGVALEEAIEKIDIGGPTMVRAAAKNHENVLVVTSPNQYDRVLESLKNDNGDIPLEMRREFALKAFQRTAEYEAAITKYLAKTFDPEEPFPDTITISMKKKEVMRYGENPHQRGAFYVLPDTKEPCLTNAIQHHGKKLSFNNILDANDAVELVKSFDRPTVNVVKHTNPCGVACAENITDAYVKAMDSDPMSAFGGVIALNRPVTMAIAEAISKIFVEIVLAPGYEDGTLEILTKKKNIRIMELPKLGYIDEEDMNFRKVTGGFLVQDRNLKRLDMNDIKVVTERKPTQEELDAMEFAWGIIGHVKSNSIIFCKEDVTVGIGAGQMSRVDAVKIAAEKSHGRSVGAVMASDAFFPFRDGIDEAHKAGITAVIHPGGSIRDQEVIDAANEYGMAMVFTGIREFKH